MLPSGISIAIFSSLVAVIFGLLFLWRKCRCRYSWKGSHVMITGGSKGIGKELAIIAFNRGANVSLIARTEQDLEQAKDDIMAQSTSAHNNSVTWYSLDLMSLNEQEMKEVTATAEGTLGPVDLLINNAGGPKLGYFDKLSLQVYDDQMKFNYLTCVGMTKAVLPGMKDRQSGRIVYISSLSGQCGIIGYSPYAAAKFALGGFVDALSMELTSYPNIRLQIAYPPSTATDRYMKQLKNEKPLETKLIADRGGQLFQPEDVAQTIIDGIDTGIYGITIGAQGWFLSLATAGASPAHTLSEAVAQVALGGVARLVALRRSRKLLDVVTQSFVETGKVS